MTQTHITIDKKYLSKIQRGGYQCGVLTRATKSLFYCYSPTAIIESLQSTFEALELSGLFTFKISAHQHTAHFGNVNFLYADQELIAQTLNSTHRITRNERWIVYTNTSICFRVSIEKNDEQLTHLLQENLAIFGDSIQEFIDNRDNEKKNNHDTHSNDEINQANLQKVLDSLSKFNLYLFHTSQQVAQDFLDSLSLQVSALPLMPEQEEAVLKIATQAISKQSALMNSQINHNNEVREALSETIHLLMLYKNNLCPVPLEGATATL